MLESRNVIGAPLKVHCHSESYEESKRPTCWLQSYLLSTTLDSSITPLTQNDSYRPPQLAT